MAKSPKERIRDTFYMDMWDKFEIEKDELVTILNEAGFEGIFDVSLLTDYESAVKKAATMKRIKKNMKPFPRTVCPYPDCDGEKISYTRYGSSQWFCSNGGSGHYMVWRIARLKALSDLKNNVIEEDKVLETIDSFIKEYEAYGAKNSKTAA